MDTRTKIVTPAEAAQLAKGATVVSGYFDPLVASQALRLSELKRIGKPLLVLIANPANPILPAPARAELVASLRVVDYVAEADDSIQPEFRFEQDDDARLANLIAHVHTRQRAAAS